MNTFHPGQIVQFANPYEDEIGLTYKVIELRGPRILIEAVCDLPFPPQQAAMVEDLEAVERA